MYYTEFGDEIKKFNTRDGMGIAKLRDRGVKVGIITSEDQHLNERRAKKLHLDYLFQGKRNCSKLETVKSICGNLGISINEVAYIGDDINCLELLSNVGLPACPSDAMGLIKEIDSIWILNSKGGDVQLESLQRLFLIDVSIQNDILTWLIGSIKMRFNSTDFFLR